jgi:cytochrome c peroxidase
LEDLQKIKLNRLVLFAVLTICFALLQAGISITGPFTKAELGRLLFFDRILSADRTISCASCHLPEYAFSDTLVTSIGIRKQKGLRNTPSAMNLSLQRAFFWDGRSNTIEEQALVPIENPTEMNLPVAEAVRRLQKSKRYSAWFREVFHAPPSRENLAESLGAFERSLETSDTPFDNWKMNDDQEAVSESAKRGFVLFNGKGKCVQCHFGADFTTNEFRNIGLFNGRNLNDSGRSLISGKTEDIGKFKVGSLRNIAVTAPYMHNGMFKTLDEVIEFYNDPARIVSNAINRDNLLSGSLNLTEDEKKDLKAFMLALTDKKFEHLIRKQ